MGRRRTYPSQFANSAEPRVVRGSPADRGRRGPVRAVWARLFRRPSRVGGEAWAATGRWDGATVPPRPVGYHTAPAPAMCGCGCGFRISPTGEPAPALYLYKYMKTPLPERRYLSHPSLLCFSPSLHARGILIFDMEYVDLIFLTLNL